MIVKARVNKRYLSCPHCKGRHISEKNIELCRKIESNYKFLVQYSNNQEPDTIFYNEVSYLMWNKIMNCIRGRFKNICTKCNNKTGQPEIHHIIPRSKGGNDHPSNLTLLCLKCHHYTHSKRGKKQKKNLENYQLSSFTPVYINIKGIEVSKEEFTKEQKRLLKPYFDHLAKLHYIKKKRGKRG